MIIASLCLICLLDYQKMRKVVLVAHSLGGSSVAYATERYPHKVGLAVYMASIMCSKFWKKFKLDPDTGEGRTIRQQHLNLDLGRVKNICTIKSAFAISSVPWRTLV